MAYDLRLFGPGGFLFSEEFWGPTLASGPAKVAQRFLYALLTPAGSVRGVPGAGTGFVDAVHTFRSEFELFAAFAAAEPSAGRMVRQAESTDDPGNERYGSSRLAGIAVESDRLTLTFTVRAADGSTPPDPVTFALDL